MTTDWPLVPLGNLLKPVSRPEPVDPSATYRILGAHWYAKGLYIKDVKPGSEIRAQKLFRVEAGDFVYNRLFGWKGSFAVATQENCGCFVSNEFPCFLADRNLLDPLYLWRYFSRSSVWQEALGLSTGGTPTSRNRLKEEKLLGLRIPLPPLAEQRRIVARIEELAAKIEAARGLRASYAIEAERISVSARHQVFSQLQRRFVTVPLDSVADSRLGKMLSAHAKTGRYSTPYLRNANIQWDRLDLSSIYEMDFDEDDKKEFGLQPGDILVCEGGDIGKAAIWNNEMPGCCYQKALHRVRVDSTRLIPRFMLYHLFWAAEQGHFTELKTQTTIPHLTGVKLKAYPVFVPTLPEQEKVVTRLDNLKDKVRHLTRVQEETAAELNALLPSILDKAFKGEL